MTKHQQTLCIMHCALCVIATSSHAEIAATAATRIAVDSREGEVCAVAPEDIAYSPFWGGVTNVDAYVVIEKVEHAGMFNAATSEIATMAAGAEGDLSYSPEAGDAPCVRLVHRVYDAGGTEIGTPLERDVAFGFATAATAGTAADGRDDLLQREAALGKVVGFAYDTSWATNADSVAISAVQLKDGRGRDLATPVTNDLFSASADAAGTFAKALKSGGWRFLHTSVDMDGNIICAPYFADYFLMSKGTTILIR
ncbi:MAG: hypothetical protein IJK04_12885 [Kiritimatiellae bacterium]|nr:hypothetical protein [Kiritimatiellia bacterium]